MRKSIISFAILAALSLSGCRIYSPQYSVESIMVDYEYYNNNDFYLTEANSVSFNYSPIGSINATSSSGYMTNEKLLQEFNEIYGQSGKKIKKNDWVGASVYEALDAAVNKAKAQGANAIINLKISQSYRYENKMKVLEFVVTGMAIRK